MNRRAFFKSMVGGLAATAAVRSWPFRVFSFPSELKLYGGARGGGKLLHAGDIIIPYTEYLQPGQMVAAFGPRGNLEKGVYRVRHVDVTGRRIYLTYEEPREFLGRGTASSWEKGPDGKLRPVRITTFVAGQVGL